MSKLEVTCHITRVLAKVHQFLISSFLQLLRVHDGRRCISRPTIIPLRRRATWKCTWSQRNRASLCLHVINMLLYLSAVSVTMTISFVCELIEACIDVIVGLNYTRVHCCMMSSTSSSARDAQTIVIPLLNSTTTPVREDRRQTPRGESHTHTTRTIKRWHCSYRWWNEVPAFTVT